MDKIYKMPFKELIAEYPGLNDVLEKYDLHCSTCDFANNFTLEELIEDKEDIKERIKVDLFRFFNA